MTEEEKLELLDRKEEMAWAEASYEEYDLTLVALEVIELCQRIRASLGGMIHSHPPIGEGGSDD